MKGQVPRSGVDVGTPRPRRVDALPSAERTFVYIVQVLHGDERERGEVAADKATVFHPRLIILRHGLQWIDQKRTCCRERGPHYPSLHLRPPSICASNQGLEGSRSNGSSVAGAMPKIHPIVAR